MRAFYGKFRLEYCEYTQNKSKKISHSGIKCLSPCRLGFCKKYGEHDPMEEGWDNDYHGKISYD